MTKREEPIASLFEADQFQHPMFKQPTHIAKPKPVMSLLWAIWKAVTPWDGRTDMDVPLAYCRAVYDAGMNGPMRQSPTWMMGRVMELRFAIDAGEGLSQRDRNIIERVSIDFAKSIFSGK